MIKGLEVVGVVVFVVVVVKELCVVWGYPKLGGWVAAEKKNNLTDFVNLKIFII